MAKRDEPEEKDEAPEAKPKKGGAGKMIAIIAGAVVLLLGSVVGTFFATRAMVAPSADEVVAEEGDEAVAEEEGGKHGEKKQKKAGKKGDKKAKDGKAEETAPEATYLPLDPPFVVNNTGAAGQRYLQVGVDVMSHDPQVIEEVKKHMPHIRNNLVMLFSSQTPETVSSREGKEKVRLDALTEIRTILGQKEGDKGGVEAVFFTSFVMQ